MAQRIERPEEKVSRWRADFGSCFLLVSSRLMDMVAEVTCRKPADKASC